jgi:hypothetical protein
MPGNATLAEGCFDKELDSYYKLQGKKKGVYVWHNGRRWEEG